MRGRIQQHSLMCAARSFSNLHGRVVGGLSQRCVHVWRARLTLATPRKMAPLSEWLTNMPQLNASSPTQIVETDSDSGTEQLSSAHDALEMVESIEKQLHRCEKQVALTLSLSPSDMLLSLSRCLLVESGDAAAT